MVIPRLCLAAVFLLTLPTDASLARGGEIFLLVLAVGSALETFVSGPAQAGTARVRRSAIAKSGLAPRSCLRAPMVRQA